MPIRAALAIVSLLELALLAGGCRSESGTASALAERFHSRGRVERVSPRELDIHHEDMAAIRGFSGKLEPMSSMTMPFATPAGGAPGIAVGDLVDFEFTTHYDAPPTLRLTHITKLPSTTSLQLH